MKKICIDLGHGKSTGASSPCKNFQEDYLNLVTGTECARLLKEAGFNILQTRTTDVNPSIDDRCKMSNNFEADFFISIHYNAGGGEGFEAVRTLRENIVSTSIANKIIKRLPQINQITRPTPLYTKPGQTGLDYFGVLRGTRCPAIIVEGAFVDNRKDLLRINSDEKLKAFGKIYAEAIIEYFK
jgi:N-acetylmuramoyl-L-alanine amidase